MQLFSVQPARVRLGVHTISDPSDASYAVTASVPHPDYRANSFYHDIGLLRLERNVALTTSIRPACLSNNRTHISDGVDEPTMMAVATGWGGSEFHGSASDRLLKVELELYTDLECMAAYSGKWRSLRSGIDVSTQMCAGSRTQIRDTCEADSGGPLQVQFGRDVAHEHARYELDAYTVVGVTSFGKPCGFVNSPGVYTRVDAYRAWIEAIVWPTTLM